MRWWLRHFGLALGLLMACAQVASSQERYREDAVKAAFLYRFAGYIEWPEEALDGQQFTIAVLGSSSIANELQKLLPQRSIKNMPARVQRIDKLRELTQAQILFVSAEHAHDIKAIVASLAGKSILLVTDRPDGLDSGSAINFLSIDRRVRFEISVDAARRANLKVGAELLSVAARVRGAPERADVMCLPVDLCSCPQSRRCLVIAAVR